MNSYRVAGFRVRFWAYILDLACVAILGSIATSIIGSSFKIPQQYLGWMKISISTVGVIGFIYFTIMTRYWGQTIGKMICGIMVIRDDGKDLDWATVFTREVAGRAISQFFGSHMGYLIIPFVKNKRSCHDLLCDTYVIHVDEFERKRWINVDKIFDKEIIDEFEIDKDIEIEDIEEAALVHGFEKNVESEKEDTRQEFKENTEERIEATNEPENRMEEENFHKKKDDF